MSEKFEIGVSVIQKTGGKTMIVQNYDEKDQDIAICMWTENGKQLQGQFHVNQLEAYNDDRLFNITTV